LIIVNCLFPKQERGGIKRERKIQNAVQKVEKPLPGGGGGIWDQRPAASMFREIVKA